MDTTDNPSNDSHLNKNSNNTPEFTKPDDKDSDTERVTSKTTAIDVTADPKLTHISDTTRTSRDNCTRDKLVVDGTRKDSSTTSAADTEGINDGVNNSEFRDGTVNVDTSRQNVLEGKEQHSVDNIESDVNIRYIISTLPNT